MGRMRASGQDPLSSREIEVLALVAGGLTNKDIARTLLISEATVGRSRASRGAMPKLSGIIRSAIQSDHVRTRQPAYTRSVLIGTPRPSPDRCSHRN